VCSKRCSASGRYEQIVFGQPGNDASPNGDVLGKTISPVSPDDADGSNASIRVTRKDEYHPMNRGVCVDFVARIHSNAVSILKSAKPENCLHRFHVTMRVGSELDDAPLGLYVDTVAGIERDGRRIVNEGALP
jgi:hypothetical protein